MFTSCSSLASVMIPASLTIVPFVTFSGCTSLTTVTISSSVTNLGFNSFGNCPNLTSVYFLGNALPYYPFPFVGDSNAMVYYLPDTTGWSNTFDGVPAEVFQSPYSFTINANETIAIDGDAGSGGTGGTASFPATIIGLPVTSIGEYAFDGVASLTNVIIPGSVSNIGQSAFAYCSSLSNVAIANGVVSIGTQAFLECAKLTSITIPGSVTSIGESALALTGLGTVYFTGNAPAVGPLLFSGGPFSVTIYYLPGTTGWGEFSLSTGQTSVPWTPLIQTSDRRFGVQNNQFGFNITNTSFAVSFPPVVIHDPSVVVEVCTNLANPVWTPLQTVTLTNGSIYFSEPFQPNTPERFYGLGLP